MTRQFFLSFVVMLVILPCFSILVVGKGDLIRSVTVNKNQLRVSINPHFKSRYLNDDFFVEYEEDIDLSLLDYSLLVMPFVCNVLPIVWISGQDYYIDALDADFYYSMEKIKKIFKRMYPKTRWKGRLIPRKLVQNGPLVPLKDTRYHRALLYSGGLDSVASSLYYQGQFKQLLITAWGQSDVPLGGDQLWQARKKGFIEYAQKNDYSNAFVRSNYSEFLRWGVLDGLSPEIKDWRADTTEGIGMIGLALPIMLFKGYSTLHIASSYTWDYPYPSAANPVVDATILCADSFRLVHDQFDFSRLDKLEYIAAKMKKQNIEKMELKVCSKPLAYNCCEDCSKCMQTIIGLLVLGEDLSRYGFFISREEALARAKKYVAKGAIFWTSWNIGKSVSYLKKKIAAGQAIPHDLAWLLQIDLTKNCDMKYVRAKTVVNWHDYEDLLPAGLSIPDYI